MGYNSTIVTKKKNLQCGHFDFNFSKGRCKQCATIDSTKKRIALANDAPKVRKIAALEQDKDLAEKIATNHAALERWFGDRRKEMTGVCANCGGKSCRDNEKYWKFSIAHLLPKAYFPSVKTHEYNWIELCHFGNSCHTNFDNKILDLIDMNCFSEIVTKFCIIYPSIAPIEKKRIPQVLLNYIEVEK